MKIGTRTFFVLVAAVLPVFGLVLPASAAGDCDRGNVCMWEDPHYSGSKYVDQPGNPGYYNIDWWDGDNEISSVVNNTDKCVTLYDEDDWSGNTYTIEKGGWRADLTQNGFDNSAQSYRIFNC